jgi:C4-dicarboxylate transporter
MAAMGIQDTLAFKLMVSIVDLVKNSGVTRQEAAAAIRATEAMITEMELSEKPTIEIQTRRKESPSAG